MFVPPNSLSLSEAKATTLSLASSLWIVSEVVIACVSTCVILPWLSTVICGTKDELPKLPGVVEALPEPITVANVVAIVAVSPPSWNVADPVASPESATVTALESPAASVAVSELPVTLPVTLPTNAPSKLPALILSLPTVHSLSETS